MSRRSLSYCDNTQWGSFAEPATVRKRTSVTSKKSPGVTSGCGKLMTERTDIGPVLLYDGTCGLCHTTVRFILRRDRVGTLRFASLDGKYGRAVVRAHPELRVVDSVVWVESVRGATETRVAVRSAAALEIARYLGGRWRWMSLVLRVVPRPLRDRAYDLVARHRHRLPGKAVERIVSPADVGDRFLDEGD